MRRLAACTGDQSLTLASVRCWCWGFDGEVLVVRSLVGCVVQRVTKQEDDLRTRERGRGGSGRQREKCHVHYCL